jgi:NDP-sugar pyrophosphorylase family protein
VLLLAADPALGSAGTLRGHSPLPGDEPCVVVVAAREPLRVDLPAMLAAHAASGALLTIAVRRRPGDGGDVLIAGDDGRVMGVQTAAHPDEALSDLADAGLYAVAPEALHHVPDGPAEWSGEVLETLLAWDAAVYVHRLD